MSEIGILDYESGNVRSVWNAIKHIGHDPILVAEPRAVTRLERLIVPGVGNFGHVRHALYERGLAEPVIEFARSGRPLWGICVGMQLLFEWGEESGETAGLGLLPGRVKAIPKRAQGQRYKLPHIGWNAIRPAPQADWSRTVLRATSPETPFYFVHSYTAWPELESDRIADTSYYGNRIAALVGRGNLLGSQFHPERSGDAGLALLERFCAL